MSSKFLWGWFFLLLVACARNEEKETVLIQIKTTEKTNRGTPLYVVVKSVSFPEFLQDNYQKIVEDKLLSQEEGSVLEKVCFIPGITKTLRVQSPKNRAVGIYCMFTDPGEEWKCYIESEESSHLKLLLGESQIECMNRF